MKRLVRILTGVALCIFLVGCGEEKTERYRGTFYGTFDTVVTIIGYGTDAQFTDGLALLQEEMERYNALFDKYNSYEGVHNIKTINDQAGIAPVEVEPELLEFLLQAKEWYQLTNGTVNIAYGPVLSIWHDYRGRYENSMEGALPSMEELEEAALRSDINQLLIDEENSTVYLSHAGMSLDVGAMAKGYAIEKAGQAVYDRGVTSFILSGGGNVRIFDAPVNPEKYTWGVGIQDPKQNPLAADQAYLDTVFANHLSVVTSGNYQRYYLVDGEKIHHIIDPATHMPANRYAAVTVVCEDSGLADLLSTAVYIMDEDAGRALAETHGAEALWIYEDGSVAVTDGLVPLLKERGGASSTRPMEGETAQ